jgi:hypothetical protein
LSTCLGGSSVRAALYVIDTVDYCMAARSRFGPLNGYRESFLLTLSPIEMFKLMFDVSTESPYALCVPQKCLLIARKSKKCNDYGLRRY